MSGRTRIAVYLDADLASEIKEVATDDGRSLANYLERVLLGSEQLVDDLQDMRRRRERVAGHA